MKKIPLKVGSVAQNNAYTGARGEITVVVDTPTGLRGLRIHDGSTMGGTDMARSADVGGGGGGGGGGEEESPYVYTTDLPEILAGYVLTASLAEIIDAAVTGAIEAALLALPVPASVNDQIAGINLSRFVTPGRQAAHPSAYKAWAFFNTRGVADAGHEYYEIPGTILSRLATINFTRSGDIFSCTSPVPHGFIQGSIASFLQQDGGNPVNRRSAIVSPTDAYSFTFQADATGYGTSGEIHVEAFLQSWYNITSILKTGEGKALVTVSGYTFPVEDYSGGTPKVGVHGYAQGDFQTPVLDTSALMFTLISISNTQQIEFATHTAATISNPARAFTAGFKLDAGYGFIGVYSMV